MTGENWRPPGYTLFDGSGERVLKGSIVLRLGLAPLRRHLTARGPVLLADTILEVFERFSVCILDG